MFRALQCPSSGARQTAVAASGFRMNVEVEVFSAVVGLLVGRQCALCIYPCVSEVVDLFMCFISILCACRQFE